MIALIAALLLLFIPGVVRADLVTTLNPRDAVSTYYPGFQPGSGELNLAFPFTTFNGLALAGQTISATFLFARDLVAHIDLRQRVVTTTYEGQTFSRLAGGSFGLIPSFETNSPLTTLSGTPSNFPGAWPGFASNFTASLLTVGSVDWPGFTQDGPSGGMGSDGSFIPGGLSYYAPNQTGDLSNAWAEPDHVDIRGMRVSFTMPENRGATITGGQFGLFIKEPSSVRFVSVPEHAILPRLPKVLPKLLGLGVERRVTGLLQHITTVLVATIFWAPYSGTEIYLERITLNVAEACAGYHTLLVMLLIGGLLVAVRRRQTIGGGLVIIAMAIAVGFAANAFRAAGIAVFLDHFGASTESQIHYGKEWIQYVVTAAALVPLLFAARIAPMRES